jgi:hypothetical protein
MGERAPSHRFSRAFAPGLGAWASATGIVGRQSPVTGLKFGAGALVCVSSKSPVTGLCQVWAADMLKRKRPLAY